MKNFTSNQSFYLKFNIINFRNGNLNLVLKSIILFLVLITFQNSIAQGTNESADIKEVNSFLTALKSTSISDYNKLEHLINGSNPAIYTKNNTLKTYGENCTVLFSDIVSLNYIKNNSIPSNKVEAVQINLKTATDLNSKIDLSIFSSFSNLKYIYIISGINTTKQSIADMILNDENDYTLLYKIDQAE